MSKFVSASVTDVEMLEYKGPIAFGPRYMAKLFAERGIKFHPYQNNADLTEPPKPVSPFVMVRDVKRNCITIRQEQNDDETLPRSN